MKAGILMTLPRSDDVTEYLFVFSQPIIRACNKKGIKIRPLIQDNATRDKFESMVGSLDYKVIIFNGHGHPNCILGHKNEELIKLGENESILKDRITYSRTCWSVLGVGKKCIENSKRGCFIGYKIPFMFFMDSNWLTNPIKDNTAKVFFDTSNKTALGLIKGRTTQEAHDNSKRSMLKEMNKALKKKDKDSKAIAQILWNNYCGQELLGNPNARLIN